MFDSGLELTYILVAIGIFGYSVARALTFHIIALIHIAIAELVYALAMLDIILPHA